VSELVTSYAVRRPDALGVVEAEGKEVPVEREPAAVAQAVALPKHFTIPVVEERWYDTLGRTFKQALMRCFCFGEEVQLWERERAFDAETRRERVTTLARYADHTVTETVVAATHALNEERVHQVPRFVGHAVDVLRVKLGMGAADRSVPGNVALVRAEAAKLMRDWNVRHRDAAAHLLLIERAFFTEGVHERPVTWRVDCTRRSRLMAFFLGRADNNPQFDY
jgi:hypothetical protein